MTWKERIEGNKLAIVTGDGKQYNPKWTIIGTSDKEDYNYSEFVYKGVAGSHVIRRLPKGRRYDLEIHFTGLNCVEQANDFLKSARNQKAWTISHPLLDVLVVQPTGIQRDFSGLSTVKLLAPCIETIGAKELNVVIDPAYKAFAKKVTADTALNDSLVKEIVNPKASTLATILKNIKGVYERIRDNILNSEQLAAFTNAYNTAVGIVNEVTSTALEIVSAVQVLIQLPALFQNPVLARINMLFQQIGILNDMLTGDGLSVQQKKVYENHVGLTIAAMCLASITDFNYKNRTEVAFAADTIIDSYNGYITNLDSIQSETGGLVTSYMPDVDAIIALQNVVMFTAAQLQIIAENAKQQRNIIVQNDINLIKLAHQLYGLEVDDTSIQALIDDNWGITIGLTTILNIPKGTNIIYYE